MGSLEKLKIMAIYRCVLLILSLCCLATNIAAVTSGHNPSIGTDDDVIVQLLERVDRLEARDKMQQDQIDVMRKELVIQENKISILETTVRTQRRFISSLLQKSDGTKESMTGEVPKVDETEKVENGPSVEDKGGNNRIRRAENEMTVAFFAKVGQHHIDHIGKNQSIAFDDVVTNVGNAYNPHFGSFVAPVAGTYIFSVTLMAYGNHITHYDFALNGHRMSMIYVRADSSNNAVSSQTIALQMKQGDDLSVRNIDAGESLHGYGYSSLTGFLLQQDYNPGTIVGR